MFLIRMQIGKQSQHRNFLGGAPGNPGKDYVVLYEGVPVVSESVDLIAYVGQGGATVHHISNGVINLGNPYRASLRIRENITLVRADSDLRESLFRTDC